MSNLAEGNQTARGDQLIFQFIRLTAQFYLALLQRCFGARAFSDLFLSRLVQAGIINGNRRLRGDADDDALGTLIEDANFRMTEK